MEEGIDDTIQLMRNGKFDLFVDTGGTFTDCIARNNLGSLIRRKVLSNGSIRGSLVKWGSLNKFVIEEKWELGNDILKGYAFRLLQKKHPPVKVLEFDIQNKILILDGSLPEKFKNQNLSFELLSGEEAPVLGDRKSTRLNSSHTDIPRMPSSA